MDTKVYLLDSGTILQDQRDFFWMKGRGGPYRLPVFSVLIEHQEGRFLFDTGMDKEAFDKQISPRGPAAEEPAGVVRPTDMVQQTPRQTLPGQLDLLGLRPRDITHVMNSHYHVDHTGGNRLCTCATTICSQKELDAARSPHPIEKLGYQDVRFLCEEIPQDWQMDGPYKPKLEVVSGDVDVAKGVTLFETPGHTAGHYSLMVKLANRRPMIFSGDACYSKASLDMMSIATYHTDPKQAYDSLVRLKDMARTHDADLFFAHDMESWPSYIKAPGYYA